MSSIQERLQMKRVPLDKWSTKEKLCLASSVACSGDQNWMSVSRSLKMLCGADRPSDWFAQKSCAAQYGKLLENVETPKRKKRTASERDGVGAVETPGESILRKLTQERIVELKKIIQEESQQYTKVKEDIILIQSGVTDEKKLREMWAQIEQERVTKEKEEQQHAQWLKEREEKKLELERQWRPMYPNSPSATTKAPTPPIKIKEETDEDSQGSNKSATSPLLTSLLKNPGAPGTPGPSSSPTTPQSLPLSGRTTSSPTITNLLTGGTSATAIKMGSPVPPAAGEKQPDSSSTAVKAAESKEAKPFGAESTTSSDAPANVVKTKEADSIKTETLDVEMDSEDIVDPTKDLMDVLEDLIPDDLDEILKENSGMILDVDLNNVDLNIMEEEGAVLKAKELDTIGHGTADVEMVDAAEKITTTASKNEQPSVESAGQSLPPHPSPPTPQPQQRPPPPLPDKPTVDDGSSSSRDEDVSQSTSKESTKQSIDDEQLTIDLVKQETKEEIMEIIPIEDSTSNSPETNQSSDDNKDSAEETSGPDNADSVIVVSDSAKEEDEEDIPVATSDSNDVQAIVEDDDSDDKPLASLDVSAESNVPVEPVKLVDDEVEDGKALVKPSVTSISNDASIRAKEPSEPIIEEKPETPMAVDAAAQPTDDAKAKKEAMDKLAASEYDFKDDEEPIVPLSIQKAKDEKHVSEDEVFEDAQETVTEEPEEMKEPEATEKPVKKSIPEDPVLTVTDTDDDSLIEMKIGKAKRDYSRRRQTDEAQKLKDDLPGYSRTEETPEGRSLRKLRDRDRSESPYVMQDDETNEKMKRSYSSTPVMDSIPGSPASSEDRDYRAWKKSILAVYSRIAALKNAEAFQKSLPEEHAADLIYRPMDLGQIKRNIENGNIRTTVEFQRDILLMCTNAIMLNRSDGSPHAARMLMRESAVLIETGMEQKAVRERDSERGTHKRSSRKSSTRHSSAGRN
ncbi:bromodomain-containing protein 8 [Anopheles aquasalis]|uniref:bromodomain-containing protein 8 n=1 Tax=Anopheles aquasalis TaxID=42839 RepID=UPI00215B2DD3|nr:bromodomain-containing protein 8 [Anopheles aquasalis]